MDLKSVIALIWYRTFDIVWKIQTTLGSTHIQLPEYIDLDKGIDAPCNCKTRIKYHLLEVLQGEPFAIVFVLIPDHSIQPYIAIQKLYSVKIYLF